MTKKQKATMERYVGALLTLRGNGDNEVAHSSADALLLEALRDLGFAPIADAWEEISDEIGFWYA